MIIQTAHAEFSSNFENTPVGMLFYYLSASFCDLVIVILSRLFLRDELLLDIQLLNLASIIANGIGWLLYLSYVPPYIYNTFVAALVILQWAALLLRGRYDNHDDLDSGGNIVCPDRGNCDK
jgi:hypothetical protein